MKELQLRAYGKINLGLDVVRKREDGYHELRMIMQTVGLFDGLTMRVIPKDEIRLTTNLSFLPTNKNNLIYKAIAMLKEEFQIKEGVEVKLDKRIPVAAGMAGGSSNAAAALVGMNRLFQLGLSKKQLMEYGVKLGADVPYCIMRGTALSEGIGEILTPLPPMPVCYILLAKPGISVSTKYVYQNLKVDELEHHPDIDGIVSAIKSGDLKGITDRLENVLETVTVKDYPIIEEVKQYMVQQGAMNALMSGSGPTIFGIFKERAVAKKALEGLRRFTFIKQAYVVEPYNIRKK
ncbi:MAG: 4-(cytidine 5'-diphospho)-2-C-methyl-D-erythritol kinase [Lachnospiraceae bacterium]|nr:4-(cytidine 5'-diphospho)-2-C-methyl-D-erythritol kinase [Lachnospiraceae bacterium]